MRIGQAAWSLEKVEDRQTIGVFREDIPGENTETVMQSGKKGRQEGWKRKGGKEGGKEGWKGEGGEGKDGWKGGGKERQMEGRKEGREETGKSHSVPQGMTSSSTLFLRLETFLFLIHMNCVTRTFSHHSQPLLSVTISLCPVSDSLPAPFFYSAARDILGQRGNILTMSKAQLTNLTSSEGKPP